MSRSSPSRARLAALAALLLGALSAACGKSTGTGPVSTLERLRAGSTYAGTWVHHPTGPDVESLLAGGEIVADTLRLAMDGTGSWAITYVDPLDAGHRLRNVITLRWVEADGGVRVIPTCGPPESLCDPIPSWSGRVGADGQLVLLPSLIVPNPHARVYMRPGH